MPGEKDTHLYGGSDEENRQTPTTDGFHGEGKAPLTDEVKPENVHTLLTSDGNRIEVEDMNGVAATEDAGTAGLKR